MIKRTSELLEKMRLIDVELELEGRCLAGLPAGVFAVVRKGVQLRIIASEPEMPEHPWEHVSVSTPSRAPTWDEMSWVKDLFWEPEECVMQLHPPRSTWVNNHPHCLHLWKPVLVNIPLPDPILVGVKSVGLLRNETEARKLREMVDRGEIPRD